MTTFPLLLALKRMAMVINYLFLLISIRSFSWLPFVVFSFFILLLIPFTIRICNMQFFVTLFIYQFPSLFLLVDDDCRICLFLSFFCLCSGDCSRLCYLPCGSTMRVRRVTWDSSSNCLLFFCCFFFCYHRFCYCGLACLILIYFSYAPLFFV